MIDFTRFVETVPEEHRVHVMGFAFDTTSDVERVFVCASCGGRTVLKHLEADSTVGDVVCVSCNIASIPNDAPTPTEALHG